MNEILYSTIIYTAIIMFMFIFAKIVTKNCDKLMKEIFDTKVGVHDCIAIQKDYQNKIDNLKLHIDSKIDVINEKLERIMKWVK